MALFDPLSLRELRLKNRIAVSPMCQYSSEDGFANDWHFTHLVSRAVGGAGLVFTEATAVAPEGRISPQDLGLWKDEHGGELARIVRAVHGAGAAAGIQLAHAGRKASTRRPWESRGAVPEAEGGWVPLGPTTEPFDKTYPVPRAATEADLAGVVRAFRDAAVRADAAGFDVVEVHAAHGYLAHQFLSPLVNTRTDAYGGTFEGRTRLVLEICDAVRAVWPRHKPLFVRISATDWVDGGWSLEDSIALVRMLGERGVDLVDCSGGGAVPVFPGTVGPGYQTHLADAIRRATKVPTGAVGLITAPAQADHVVRTGQADLVLVGRETLRNPYWPLEAARALGVDVPWPVQYERAKR